jgi:hypothetical protein
MAVNNAENVGPLLPKTPQNVNDVNVNRNQPAPDAAAKQQGAVLDTVEISNKAKMLNAAVNAMNNMPEVRNQAVQAATQQRVVENNRVPAGQLAAKLLFKE